jgi:hypothetical protein
MYYARYWRGMSGIEELGSSEEIEGRQEVVVTIGPGRQEFTVTLANALTRRRRPGRIHCHTGITAIVTVIIAG